ncbi:hypothetical protein ACHAXT_002054 [Thalassiosira profunda]
MGLRSLSICLVLAALAGASLAFAPGPSSIHRPRRGILDRSRGVDAPSSSCLGNALAAASKPVEITFPTPDAAAEIGIRDWPQQYHSSTWTDDVPEGGIATRYILEGRGRVTIDYMDDNGERQRMGNQRVYPGTLVEVDGEAKLLWEVDDANEGMIVLTPSYEEGGKLLLVGGFLLVFCAGLLVGAGGF